MANKVLGFTIQINGTEAAVNNATDLKLAITEINKALKTTTDPKEYAKLNKELIRLKASQKEVNAQVREQVKAQQANLEVTADSVGTYRKLTAQLSTARAKYKDLAAAGKANSAEAQKWRAAAEKLDKQLKEIDSDVGQFQRSVGDYRNAIKETIPLLGQWEDGLENIGKATSKTGKFIATSFFVFSIIQQLAQGAQALKEFADEFREFRGLIEQQSGAVGEELDEAASKATAIARTYKQNAEDIILAANTISKEFNISLGEALDGIERGFRKGANASGDFLQNLREYSAQTSSLDELLTILVRSSEEGIFSDKGIDAVKEFNLRIQEQTKATRDALEFAFGEQFTNELFGNINSGAITTTEALKLVSQGLNDTNLTAQQTQEVVANVFGGPGEDAGLRYLQLLSDIGEEVDETAEATSEYQKQQEELYEANEELAFVQNELAKALSDSGVEFEILQTKAKAFLIGVAKDVLQFIDRFPATLAGIRAGAKQAVDNIIGLFRRTAGEIQILTLKIEKANPFGRTNEQINEDIKKVREAIIVSRESGISVGEAYREAFLDELDKIEAENLGVEIATQQAEAARKEGAKAIQAVEKETTAEKRRQREEEKRLLELQKQRRAEVEKLLLTNRLATSLATENIGIIGDNREIEKSFQFVIDKSKETEDELTEIFKRLGEVAGRTNEEIAEDLIGLGTKITGTAERIADVAGSVLGTLSDIFRVSGDRQQAAFDERISRQEEELEILRERASQATGIRRQQLQQQLKEEEAALNEQSKQRDKAEKENAKKQKAISIIQSIVNTALAVTKALASLPFPANIAAAIATGLQGAAQTAIIAAQPLATGGIVKGIDSGLITAVPNIPRLSNGDNILATVRRGEVVLNQGQQAALGGAPTFASIGVPGFADGGVFGPPIPAPAFVGRGRDVEELKALVLAVDRKTDAVNSRIDRIKTYVVSEEISDDITEGAAIRADVTLE